MGSIDFALQVMLIGFSLVMFTLFLLYLVIVLLGKFFGLPVDSYGHQVRAIEESEIERNWAVEGVSPLKVAAISAAIYSYLYDSKAQFVIKKIEPVNKTSTSKWTLQGRKELLNVSEELEKARREKSGKKIF